MGITKNIAKFFKRSTEGNLHDIMGAVDNALDIAKVDIVQLDLEFIIATASGDWLAEWGSWFGVTKTFGESDIAFRARIQGIAARPRNTIPAIIASIRSYIGNADDDITIYEPFVNMKKFNISTFSGPDRFPDAIYYRPAVIDIRTNGVITNAMRAIVDHIKSAGVKVYFTFSGEIGTKDPLFMGSIVNPIAEYYTAVDMIALKYYGGENTTIVNIGMSYADYAIELDMVLSNYENFVDMQVNMFKNITAGSLRVINTLLDEEVGLIDSVADNSQFSVEIETT